MFKQTITVACDTEGCAASVSLDHNDEKEANVVVRANGWETGPDVERLDIPSQYHTCPWCLEKKAKNEGKPT